MSKKAVVVSFVPEERDPPYARTGSPVVESIVCSCGLTLGEQAWAALEQPLCPSCGLVDLEAEVESAVRAVLRAESILESMGFPEPDEQRFDEEREFTSDN